MEYLKSIFDLTKLPPKFFLLFSIVSGFILFGKPTWLETIQVSEFGVKYGQYIGLTFIISTGLVIINLLLWFQRYYTNKMNVLKFKKGFREKLKMLDHQEQAVLREFILQGRSAIEMPIDDPTVSGLINNSILKINRQLGNAFIMNGTHASLSLIKRAEKEIQLSDIGMSQNPSDEEIEFVKNNRPEWTDRWHRRSF